MVKKSARFLLVAGIVAAFGVGGATAATAAPCGDIVETGCEYCSRNGSNTASSSWNCDNGRPGYRWVGCNVWVTGTCAA